ncbi:S8 family peptidase [Inconstantimicrobium mannanitabidum]|uniref:Uncharacterized protein n=1 Tax=Inconstantimicrobium mannanitabidum TaxID=1604901 RepID=A0ACB5RBB4_9CLOT|nr:S8/S53 family peptidase [Clostridium sp. TW13]GKX66509.1 hypothetical protein rsdtw13_17670 [Clostridium sp. TW13]
MFGYKKKILTFFLAVILFVGILSPKVYASNTNYLYYKDKLRTVAAANLLKNKKLSTSYVVVLDNGIQFDYYSRNLHKYVADAKYLKKWDPNLKRWDPYFLNPWTSYSNSINHGTEVEWVVDEISDETRVNSSKPNVMSIQYKINDASGHGDVNSLVYAINDVVNYYVKQKHLNIAAINYSSGISWRKGTPISIINNDKKRIQAAINNAVKNGITVICSVGNDNKPIYSYPALSDNVIAVGATNSKNGRFLKKVNNEILGSCYGKQVDIVAPGQDVQVNDTREGSGTSYSAPMVAATVGILKSINPKLKPAQIENILKSTATDLGAKGKDNYFGYGLLNVEKAVKYALTHK